MSDAGWGGGIVSAALPSAPVVARSPVVEYGPSGPSSGALSSSTGSPATGVVFTIVPAETVVRVSVAVSVKGAAAGGLELCGVSVISGGSSRCAWPNGLDGERTTRQGAVAPHVPPR